MAEFKPGDMVEFTDGRQGCVVRVDVEARKAECTLDQKDPTTGGAVGTEWYDFANLKHLPK